MLVLLLAYTGYAQEEILGEWKPHEGNSIVEIYKTESGECAGKIVWLEKPTDKRGNPHKDLNNPDAALRNRTIIGMDMLENLVYREGVWTGTLYTPKKGRKVDAELSINEDDQLDINVSFRGFSRKVTWTRTELPK